MKHIALYLIFTTSSLLLTGQAFSYGDNSKYDGVFSLQKQTFSIEHQGKVGAQFNVFDSERKNFMDVLVREIRYGLTMKSGEVSQVDLEFSFGSYKEPVTVRKATLGFKVFNTRARSNESYQGILAIGRYRPDGADGYGGDATSTPNGYDFMDGLFFTQSIEFHRGLNTNILIGFGNNLAVFNQYDSEIHSLSKTIITKSLTLKKAFIAGLDVSKVIGPGALRFKAYGAMMNDAPNSIKGVYAGTPDVSYPGGFKVEMVQDLVHLEGSLGWEHDKWITAGVFGEFSTINKERRVNDIDSEFSGKYAYDPVKGAKKTTFMNVGFGVRGNTSKFMHSLLESGDTLTYGLAYVYKYAKNSKHLNDDGTFSYNDENRNQITAGFGYQASSGMTLELNWKFEKSGGNNKYLFKNDNGITGKEDTNQQAYLKATYKF
jgi:hypothetical protein